AGPMLQLRNHDFHALRRRFFPSGVVTDASDALHATRPIEKRENGAAHPQELAITWPLETVLASYALTGPDPLNGIRYSLSIFRDDYIQPALQMIAREKVAQLVAEAARENRAPVFQSQGFRVANPEDVGGGLGELPEPFVALAQRRLGSGVLDRSPVALC